MSPNLAYLCLGRPVSLIANKGRGTVYPFDRTLIIPAVNDPEYRLFINLTPAKKLKGNNSSVVSFELFLELC